MIGARLIAAGLAGLALASCATAPADVAPPPGSPTAASESRAARLARTLLAAERAEAADDGPALAEAAERLARIAPEAASEADEARLARWLEALPEDAPPMRGRALGPAYRSGTLDPGASATLEQTFLGGRAAQIVLRVAKGPDLRLTVRDQADRQVCDGRADPVECRWTPLYTQRHRIEIANDGPRVSKFYIVFD
ncbi:hypothetical protein [Erythrobacter sp.]|uniref:hypothetical protein n=1 Tax=Erythrobacter sp. TaxID=1042 RepID=UPI001425D5E2|nr:hypothetical protein [Erythrobacter sp.]QIQ87024.1 MAG: hypothetical protein G9473_10285 [Erythrobacter sp.]